MVNFILSVVTTPAFYIPAAIVGFGLVLWAMYAIGERNGAHHQYEKEQAHLEAIANPSPAERKEMSIVEAITREIAIPEKHTRQMEAVGYLEPVSATTGLIPVISRAAQIANEVAVTGIINLVPPEESISRLNVEVKVLQTKVIEMTAKYQRADMLRRRHWNSVKAERARNRHLFRTYDLPRRPSKPRLLAEVIDISTRAEHKVVHLVPSTIASIWREDLLVA